MCYGLAADDQPPTCTRRGRLYFQLGVPSSGPPIPPGSVCVRPTGDARGNGAFATALLPKGAHVCDYEGERISRQEYARRYPDGVVGGWCRNGGQAVGFIKGHEWTQQAQEEESPPQGLCGARA